MKYLNRIPVPLVLFFTLWAWAWGWWGDVLWTAHERSFFAFENELVQHVWSKSFGSLWLMGRAMLSLCAWPWLGALLLAVMLTGTACCLKYVFARQGSPLTRGIVSAVCLLLPLAWTAHLAYDSFDAYFKSEPGAIFGIPALAFIVAAIQALFVWTFRRHKRTAAEGSAVPAWALSAAIVAITGLTMVCEKQFRPWTRPTAAMERAYADEDWTRIRQIATDNATVSCRPMACYYAIALLRQQALMQHLFDIRFEYDDVQMHDWSGELMDNTLYYVAEADMHAGLLQFAYHKAIEDMTVDGPTIHNLKTLVRVTAMRHENTVCRKYLAVLDRTPGTSAFTARWRAYMADSGKMEADATVKGIRELEPMRDAFESAYTAPAFLGYNLQLFEGRSQQALLASIAVCLYTKLMPPFMERAQYLGVDGVMHNPIVADALAMQSAKHPDVLRALPQLQFNLQRYQSFVNQMRAAGATGNTEERKPYADQMLTLGYYPYYYFFGNLRATRSDAAAKYGYGQNDGVN